jgi:hypothetical protein
MRRALPYLFLVAGVGVACGNAFTEDGGGDDAGGNDASTIDGAGDDGSGDDQGIVVPDAGHDAAHPKDGGADQASDDAADDVVDDTTTVGMDATQLPDATPDVETIDATPLMDVSVPPTPDACASEIADETTGYFVAAGGASSSCGSRAVPCGSVQTAVSLAAQFGKPNVYVAAGTYTEQLTLSSHVTVQGGWVDQGSVWSRDCGAANAADVQIDAPSTAAVTVVANGVIGVVLDTLTINSKPESAVGAGESVYGIMATNGAQLSLVNVAVSVVAAGAGGGGGVGSPGSGVTICTTPSDGNAGGPGAGGVPGAAGSYGASGFSTGSAGGTGSTGIVGDNGTAGGSGVSASCTVCTSSECPPPNNIPSCHLCQSPTPTPKTGTNGTPGCGGNGGQGGTGGSGGGSSVGVYAWASTVEIAQSKLRAGNGGAGGPGGGGGAGVGGSNGAPGSGTCGSGACTGTTMCGTTMSTDLGGSAGGTGGSGGSGGAGGGGAGGDSFAWYAAGGGTVTADGSTSLSNGNGGQGGSGGHSGPAGTGAQHN